MKGTIAPDSLTDLFRCREIHRRLNKSQGISDEDLDFMISKLTEVMEIVVFLDGGKAIETFLRTELQSYQSMKNARLR